MFTTWKLFSANNAVTRAARILLRWGSGVVITALGFQAVYSLLMELE
jgi:hypothetical protein